MSGCKQPHCSNTPYCATATNHSVPLTEARMTVKPQVDGMLSAETEFHLCVDEAVQRRTFLAGMVAAEGGFHLEWCKKAIEEAKGDLAKARLWLEQNARRNDE